MAPRLVSSRPGPRRKGGNAANAANGAPRPPAGRPPRKNPPSGWTRIAGFVFLALCLIGLYAAFAWQPCAECAATM